MTTFIFLSGETLDGFAHTGANNTAVVDFVEIAIFIMIALVHLLEVAQQRLAGNSEPVSLESEIPRQEARSL